MLLRAAAARAPLLAAGLPGGLASARWASSISQPEQPGLSDTDGDALLDYWTRMLQADRRRAAGELSDADVRQLLHTALRLRGGKAQSSLPDQLMALFIRFYRGLDPPERRTLFHSLTDGFGVQAREVDAAAEAWRAARLQQQQQRAHHTGAVAGGAVAPASPPAAPAGSADPVVRAAAADYPAAPEPLQRVAQRLAAAATPLYSRLFVPLSQQPGGIKFLVDLRADLLQAIQERPAGAAPLRALADALRAQLAEWFSVGLLQLQRISWEHSPPALLEKVAAGEAVHTISGWADLKGRLEGRNRRVYAFAHQAMPGEPLVVLHTALTSQVASSMAEVLPPAAAAAAAAAGSGPLRRYPAAAAPPGERTWERQAEPPAAAAAIAGQREGEGGHGGAPAPSTAVFWSISATQRGLAGVDLGNFLIKQVARCVLSEFPSVTTLCTLSPLPGFADWLNIQLARAAQGLPPAAPLLLPGEAAALLPVAAGHVPAEPGGAAGERHSAVVLGWALDEDAWLHSSRLEAALRAPLLRLAAHYLLRERRRGLALDPVANFHLRNGASLLRLNWRADLSPAGLRRSHGLMVNYHYELDRLALLNRAYLVDGVVTAAPAVEALLLGGGGGGGASGSGGA